MQCAFEILGNNINQGSENIIEALSNSSLQLQRVFRENNDFYKDELKPVIKSGEWEDRAIEDCQYWQKKLQNIIDYANNKANKSNKRKSLVQFVFT